MEEPARGQEEREPVEKAKWNERWRKENRVEIDSDEAWGRPRDTERHGAEADGTKKKCSLPSVSKRQMDAGALVQGRFGCAVILAQRL